MIKSAVLAYLIAHPDSEGVEIGHWLPRLENAMRRLDLIVFVPIEHPDRVLASDPEDRELRRRVDEELRDLVIQDRWDFGLETIEVPGTLRERTSRVLAYLKRR